MTAAVYAARVGGSHVFVITQPDKRERRLVAHFVCESCFTTFIDECHDVMSHLPHDLRSTYEMSYEPGTRGSAADQLFGIAEQVFEEFLASYC